MKRHLLALLVAGFVGSMLLVGNAEACHMKKCACALLRARSLHLHLSLSRSAPVCTSACAPRKHCGLFKGLKLGGCFHKKASPPAPVMAPCGEIVTYAAPVYSSAQGSAQH